MYEESPVEVTLPAAKKKEKLIDILEPNSGFSHEEITKAKQQLRDIAD